VALIDDVCDDPTCEDSEDLFGPPNLVQRASNCDLNTHVNHDEEAKEMNSLVGHDLFELSCFLSFRDGVHVFASFEQAR
jgi:hypothetical protein